MTAPHALVTRLGAALRRTAVALVLFGSVPATAQLLASGDVGVDSAVVWVRPDRSGDYQLEVALDAEFEKIQQRVPMMVGDAAGLTVQTTVGGLSASTRYHYRLRNAQGPLPAHGVFTTAPQESARAPLTLLFGADLGGQGYGRLRADVGLPVDGWPIFKPMLAEKADLFLALGDMIYSDRPIGSSAPDREYPKGNDYQIPKPGPGFVSSVEDFRRDWYYHRSDHRFDAFLRATPMIATWDDHEIVNDSGGPELVQGPNEAEASRDVRLRQGDPSRPRGEFMPWSTTKDPRGRRKSVFFNPELFRAGRQAMFEYNPIRAATDPSGRFERRLYRSVRWGAHAEIFMLDTRSYRDPRYRIDSDHAPKTMLGEAQKRWLLERLEKSDATWKIVVSSVPLSVEGGNERDPQGHGYRDGWAAVTPENPYGYGRELKQIVSHIRTKGVRNVVFLTGDKHFSNVFSYDPDADGVVDFHEINVGPLRAGRGSGKLPFDTSLNPTRLYTDAGSAAFVYGWVRIDPTTGRFEAELRDVDGATRPGSRLVLAPR